MSEIINGEPNTFVINRSESPVASNIRITIGENFPPFLSASRYPLSSSSISLNGSTSYTSFCEDSILENPILEWKIKKNNQLLDTIQNAWFQLKPSEYNFSHGEIASISLTCTDSHNANSSCCTLWPSDFSSKIFNSALSNSFAKFFLSRKSGSLDNKSGIIVNKLAKMTNTQGSKSLVEESIANDIASPAILVMPLNLLLAKL